MSDPYAILTWREGPFVRTTVHHHGREIDLPWLIDCLTHSGARRKARRAIRRRERALSPKRVIFDGSDEEF